MDFGMINLLVSSLDPRNLQSAYCTCVGQQGIFNTNSGTDKDYHHLIVISCITTLAESRTQHNKS
jgi:hypothetical protein